VSDQHRSLVIDRYRLEKAARRHTRIRAYFLRHLGDEDAWRKVSADPRRFNRVWRRMLRLAPDDSPPPAEYRR
jgi:hypothetical protein